MIPTSKLISTISTLHQAVRLLMFCLSKLHKQDNQNNYCKSSHPVVLKCVITLSHALVHILFMFFSFVLSW